jgi:hypothetical protein
MAAVLLKRGLYNRERHEQVEPMQTHELFLSSRFPRRVRAEVDAVDERQTFLQRTDFSVASAKSQCIFRS